MFSSEVIFPFPWHGFMNFNERQYMRENCLKIQPLLVVAFNCAKKDNTVSDRPRTNSASHYLPGCPKDQPMSPESVSYKDVANNVHGATKAVHFLEIILRKSMSDPASTLTQWS